MAGRHGRDPRQPAHATVGTSVSFHCPFPATWLRMPLALRCHAGRVDRRGVSHAVVGLGWPARSERLYRPVLPLSGRPVAHVAPASAHRSRGASGQLEPLVGAAASVLDRGGRVHVLSLAAVPAYRCSARRRPTTCARASDLARIAEAIPLPRRGRRPDRGR